jgi:hypothetical protein
MTHTHLRGASLIRLSKDKLDVYKTVQVLHTVQQLTSSWAKSAKEDDTLLSSLDENPSMGALKRCESYHHAIMH